MPGRRPRLHAWPPLVALGLIAVLSSPALAAGELLVAGAADLAHAFREVLPAFERARGVAARLVLGSTGQLRQQLEHGAPYDVFFAADTASVEALRDGGLIRREDVHVYAVGTLVLAWRADGPPLTGLRNLCRETVHHVSIANPAHAPYGKAAREALTRAGVWDCVSPRLVYGESVAHALQFLSTGNVEAALLAAALTRGSGLRQAPVERSLYSPMAQAAGVLARSPRYEDGRALIRFVLGPEGRTILERFGFRAPAGG